MRAAVIDFFEKHQGYVLMNLDPAKLPSLNIGIKINGWNTIVSFWDGLFSGA